MFVRLWGQPVAAVIRPSALSRLSKQRQFPIAITNIPRQRSYAKKQAESDEKEAKEKKAKEKKPKEKKKKEKKKKKGTPEAKPPEAKPEQQKTKKKKKVASEVSPPEAKPEQNTLSRIVSAANSVKKKKAAPEKHLPEAKPQPNILSMVFATANSVKKKKLAPEIHLPEVHPPEVHPPEVHPPEVHPPEVHPPEVHPPEVESRQSTLSKIVAAANSVLGKLKGVEAVAVETSPSHETNVQDFPLSAEQEALVSLALEGHNIFYTGSAGCGKSVVLKAIRRRFLQEKGEYVDVLAPTGKVALANEGKTTWSFAGWTPNSHKMSLFELTNPFTGRNMLLFERLEKTKTIIIDEISMVESGHFDRLNALMKAAKKSSRPFGGVQIIVTGDFCQLPPVKPFRNCFNCGSDLRYALSTGGYLCLNQDCYIDEYNEEGKWAFKSKAWQECNFRYVYLATVYRQKDPAFLDLLHKCRLGLQLDDADLKLLTHADGKTNKHSIKLFPTRAEVRKVNDAEFRRLRTPPQVYRCVDIFLWHKKKHGYLEDKQERATDGSLKALSDHNFEVELQLKEGMEVLLLHNLDIESGLYNGAQGKIIGFEPFWEHLWKHLPEIPLHGGDLPVYQSGRNEQKKAFQQFMRQCQNAKGWPIVQFQDGPRKTIYPVCHSLLLGEERPYSLMGRMQIPLTAAWALSIHKSQGMTLDSAVVSIGKAFEEGQIYVALSRVKTLAGLKVEGDLSPLREFKGDRVVQDWLKKTFGEEAVMGKKL